MSLLSFTFSILEFQTMGKKYNTETISIWITNGYEKDHIKIGEIVEELFKSR